MLHTKHLLLFPIICLMMLPSLSEKHFGLISQLASCLTNKDEDKTSQMTPMIILYYCSELVQNIFNMEALQIKVASRNF